MHGDQTRPPLTCPVVETRTCGCGNIITTCESTQQSDDAKMKLLAIAIVAVPGTTMAVVRVTSTVATVTETTIVAAAVYHEWHIYSVAVAMVRSGGRHGTNGCSERATTTNSAFHK